MTALVRSISPYFCFWQISSTLTSVSIHLECVTFHLLAVEFIVRTLPTLVQVWGTLTRPHELAMQGPTHKSYPLCFSQLMDIHIGDMVPKGAWCDRPTVLMTMLRAQRSPLGPVDDIWFGWYGYWRRIGWYFVGPDRRHDRKRLFGFIQEWYW
jgi:hypothetical protein